MFASVRRASVMAIALVLTMAQPLCIPSPALADHSGANCTLPSSHNNTAYQAAANQTVSPWAGGVESTELEYDAYYSGSNWTGTNGSVLLVKFGSPTSWTQLGWAEWRLRTSGNAPGRQVFSQTYADNGAVNYINGWPAKPVGSYSTYRLLNTTGTWVYFYVNGSYYLDVGLDYTPTTAEVLAETHDQADQFPGGTNSKMRFTQTYYRAGSDTTWYGFTAAPFTTGGGSWPHITKTSAEYDTWDSRCTL